MQKPTQYDVKDSNVENIGSEMDKAARNAAAMTECEWDGAGKAPGIEIWRVENRREGDVAKFGIKRVPKQYYRQFYRGDSYIVLYTYKVESVLRWNIHFWIGSSSTQDEFGVAAYKAVELDDLLGGAPVQYRECEGSESALFLSYFSDTGVCPGGIQYLEGGIESGFRRAQVAEPSPQLFHIRRELKTIKANEVPLTVTSLNEGDCFVLSSAGKVFIYRGPSSDPFEKNKAAAVAQEIADKLNGKAKVVDASDDDAFWALLGATPGTAIAPPVASSSAPVDRESASTTELYSLDDNLKEFVLVAQGPLQKSQLRGDDVMLIYTGHRVFVFIGAAAPREEKAVAMFKAQGLLSRRGLPGNTCVTRVLAGQEDQAGPLWGKCFA